MHGVVAGIEGVSVVEVEGGGAVGAGIDAEFEGTLRSEGGGLNERLVRDDRTGADEYGKLIDGGIDGEGESFESRG